MKRENIKREVWMERQMKKEKIERGLDGEIALRRKGRERFG